jgi:hypothetical protein
VCLQYEAVLDHMLTPAHLKAQLLLVGGYTKDPLP